MDISIYNDINIHMFLSTNVDIDIAILVICRNSIIYVFTYNIQKGVIFCNKKE